MDNNRKVGLNIPVYIIFHLIMQCLLTIKACSNFTLRCQCLAHLNQMLPSLDVRYRLFYFFTF